MPGSTPHHLGESNMSKNNSAVATASKSAVVETTHSQPLNGRENVEAILLEAMKQSDGPGEPLVRNERMYESIRQNEYDLNSALAELPDNSVEAGAKNIWVVSRTEDRAYAKNSKKTAVLAELAVIDDGQGMDRAAQNKSLVLGDSARKPRPDGRRGIGKFGVGLVTGSLSIARRIEVYTRDRVDAQFTYTLIDLDLISKAIQTSVPVPIEKEPPAEYKKYLEKSTGTIVVLSKCDRLQYDSTKQRGIPASEQLASLPHFLGRTYRKFIANGVRFWFNENPIHLHDPLYLLGPTKFDLDNAAVGQPPDLKATKRGETVKITLDIPDQPDKTADVLVTMSLLPPEWRTHTGAGGSAQAKVRYIDENEGISILRAEREVLYGVVPYITGKRGGIERVPELDRFWGCEISFPPELDEYFHVRYIKRGAEPVPSLRDKIREVIGPVVAGFRNEIKTGWKKTEAEKAQQAGVYRDAADIMTEADATQPRGERGQDVPPEVVDETLERIATESTDTTAQDTGKKKRELAAQPFSIVPVSYPQSFFFEPIYLPGRIVIKLNINHPFYAEVLAPLCGSMGAMDEESDIDTGAETPEQRRIRRAIMLLLLSYAKAESFFDPSKLAADPDPGAPAQLLENLRYQWGLALGAATRKLAEKE
jgi:Histidine kinase-, DNA gyrase B-, and HSP90-like ATPase